ncbi:hypothetical protein DPMN_078115 [Dreissena polymorpha]|uniref:Uncharacterized protein n=1 Tax=Dreissena polymorpha TaxID=45954 RepID=A0A9D3YLP3_DREPO|nr:hypothetical protein DPMN_078115 [Dreissena polymorpha]
MECGKHICATRSLHCKDPHGIKNGYHATFANDCCMRSSSHNLHPKIALCVMFVLHNIVDVLKPSFKNKTRSTTFKIKTRNDAAEADAYPHAACLTQGRPRVGNGAMHSRGFVDSGGGENVKIEILNTRVKFTWIKVPISPNFSPSSYSPNKSNTESTSLTTIMYISSSLE